MYRCFVLYLYIYMYIDRFTFFAFSLFIFGWVDYTITIFAIFVEFIELWFFPGVWLLLSEWYGFELDTAEWILVLCRTRFRFGLSLWVDKASF